MSGFKRNKAGDINIEKQTATFLIITLDLEIVQGKQEMIKS